MTDNAPSTHISGASDEHEPAAARRTVQRDAVLAALRESPSFMSAQSLYDRLQDGPVPVALATVYRHLNAFAESGLADTLWRSGHQSFRACSVAVSHHHVVCRSCDRGADIEPPVDWLNEAVEAEGFHLEHVVLEVEGRCALCTV